MLEKEKQLIETIKDLSAENSNTAVAKIIALKNTLILNRINMNELELSKILLKNYIPNMFVNKDFYMIEINSKLLANDINGTLELITNTNNIRHYLAYLYVKNITKGNEDSKDDKHTKEINFLLEELDKIDCSKKQVRLKHRVFQRKISSK